MIAEYSFKGLNSPNNQRYLEKRANTPPTNYSSNLVRKNAWDEFCELNDIFPRYREVSINNLKIADDDTGSFVDKAIRFVSKPKSVILMGKAGRGKTHFMFAILRGMFDNNFMRIGDVRYFDHVELERRLQEEMIKYKSSRYLIETLSSVPILLLDDFGIDTGTQRHERDFYEIFNKRFGKELITIISTNLDTDGIAKAYGERIVSRLQEAVTIKFNGQDLRG
jgi:DNA replication protein DnaC